MNIVVCYCYLLLLFKDVNGEQHKLDVQNTNFESKTVMLFSITVLSSSYEFPTILHL